MFDFHFQVGSARRKSYKVKGDVCSIGSARSNDLILNTRKVGKRHAELRMRPEGVYIKDLGSMSGCWVNRDRIMEYGPLTDLDEIMIGDVSILLGSNSISNNSKNAPDHAEGSAPEPAQNQASYHVAGNQSLNNGANSDQVVPESKPAKRSLFKAFGFGQSSSDEAEQSAEQNTNPSANRNTDNTGEQQGTATDVVAESQAAYAQPAPSDANRLNTDAVSAISAPSQQIGEPANAAAAGAHMPSDASPEETAAAAELAYWATVVHDQLLYQMDLRRKDVNRMSDDELRSESVALIDTILESLNNQLPDELDREELKQNVINEAVGLGPLEKFLDDPDVTEVMVNNHAEIFVERAGKLERSPYRFSSDRTVYSVIERIITPLGRRIDESSPIVDARLKDGSRVNAIIPPLALKGPSLTIRKFPKHRLQFSDLVKYDSVSQDMVDFLKVCVEMRKNIIVAGGTGSGKTTLLNVLSNFIPDTDRIVTIEDAAELKLIQPNLVSLESRPSNLEGKGAVPIRDLVKNSLRMRPDRVVVGECRGGEALDMLQAMNTGHDGSLTTIHANNPRDVVSRLEVLVLMAGMDLPVNAIREQVSSAVHMIIQQTRFHCGSRKISKITEVVGVESGTVQLQDIFVFDQQGVDENHKVRGCFKATGNIPTFYEELRDIGMDVDVSVFQNASGF